jgi:hypothetical protein
VSIAATIFSGRVLDDEAPVTGALSAAMRSTVLGEDREFFVHLPEGYGLTRRRDIEPTPLDTRRTVCDVQG